MEELEISENTLKSMLEVNPELNELTKKDIEEHINILKLINCSKSQILNIITSNSLYLSKTIGEINNLINYLKKLGFKTLNILFETNPYIFNLEMFEIENYINNRINNNEDLEDIIDDLDSNPSIFLEI